MDCVPLNYSCCRRQLIDQREIEPRYPKRILSRKVHIAGFQAVTWIFWNCQHMAMSDEDKTLEDATFSDMLLFIAGNLNVLEETGFDVSKFLNKDDDIEMIFGQQRVRLYIIAGVKDDTAFAPLTKKEISFYY
ncbi:hypothetical protein CsSME_00037671 [Camellia sinensis var. sinensis]